MGRVSRFALLLLAALLACSTREEQSLNALLGRYNRELGRARGSILLIPLDGCGTCIAPSVAFANESVSTPGLLVVASSLERKRFGIHFTQQASGSNHFIRDTLCLIQQLGLVATSPQVIFHEGGRVVSSHKVNPGNTDSLFRAIRDWH
jgi:hypothetical protein